MTISEFKAWLEGFEAAFDGPSPNAEQWAAIKKKLASIQSSAASNPSYDDMRRMWMSNDYPNGYGNGAPL